MYFSKGRMPTSLLTPEYRKDRGKEGNELKREARRWEIEVTGGETSDKMVMWVRDMLYIQNTDSHWNYKS